MPPCAWPPGDDSHQPWDQTGEERRGRSLAGVDMHLANPRPRPSSRTRAWMKAKIEAGWTLCRGQNVEAKQHPACCPTTNCR